jgi:hypothetical protein
MPIEAAAAEMTLGHRLRFEAANNLSPARSAVTPATARPGDCAPPIPHFPRLLG